MVGGGVVGSGAPPVETDVEPAPWLNPSEDMMPNMADALMPAANVRAAAAR
jgi:hypothetical protein